MQNTREFYQEIRNNIKSVLPRQLFNQVSRSIKK